MKVRIYRFAGSFALLLTFLVAGCATILSLDYNPLKSPDNVLASADSVKIRLEPFEDVRENSADPKLIGGVKRAVISQVEPVLSDKVITEVMHNALTEEFTRNAHTVVASGEDFVIKGQIKEFWVHTDITADAPSEWDVIAEIKVMMEVVKASTGDASFVGPYHGKNVELRYIVPDGAIYTRVIEAALSDMMLKLNADTDLATLLGKK